MVILMNGENKKDENKKAFTVRIDKELYKKMVIKATLKEITVNKYVTALIDADAGDVKLSGIIDE